MRLIQSFTYPKTRYSPTIYGPPKPALETFSRKFRSSVIEFNLRPEKGKSSGSVHLPGLAGRQADRKREREGERKLLIHLNQHLNLIT